MIHWIHHLFNIDCAVCAEDRVCKSCEALKEALAIERQFNKVMFDRITLGPPAKPDVPMLPAPKPLTTHVPWQVKKQILEAEEREKAKVLKSIGDLEKEIGLEEEAENVR